MEEKKYYHLIGKSPGYVFKELGVYTYNFSYPSRWAYKIKDTKVVSATLYVYFDNNNIVNKVVVTKKNKIKWWMFFLCI